MIVRKRHQLSSNFVSIVLTCRKTAVVVSRTGGAAARDARDAADQGHEDLDAQVGDAQPLVVVLAMRASVAARVAPPTARL